MLDTIKKKNTIIDFKKPIKIDENEDNFTNVIYILHEQDIVYIGRTSQSVLKYVGEKSLKYHSTHYYSEQIELEVAEDYLAELILKLQPMYNKNVPKNSKYISSNMAKIDYFIDKKDFKKTYKEFGGIEFNGLLYIEKQIFDDVYGISAKYHRDMPKTGTLIVDFKDYKRIGLNINCYIQEFESNEDFNENGDKIEEIKITHKTLSAIGEFNKLEKLMNLAYEVVGFIDSENFIAINHNINMKKQFNVKDYSYNFGERANNDETWLKIPQKYAIEELRNRYIEEVQKELTK